jgi:hypothetical protein
MVKQRDKDIRRYTMDRPNKKFRTSSIYIALNKHGIKAVKKLRDIANGTTEGTASECAANESILRLLLPYDPALVGVGNEAE